MAKLWAIILNRDSGIDMSLRVMSEYNVLGIVRTGMNVLYVAHGFSVRVKSGTTD
jgi:hypothetical protein